MTSTSFCSALTSSYVSNPGSSDWSSSASLTRSPYELQLPHREERKYSFDDESLSWTKGPLLGKGGFGFVYQGLCKKTGQIIAVKQIELVQNDDSSKQQTHEFRREVELLKTLNHPNIVRYLGTSVEYNTLNMPVNLFVLLEYVPGGSIHSLLCKFGAFPETVVQTYTGQTLQGLSYLHENRIIHRDVKGANILVDTQGCVKLADFGCSKSFVDTYICSKEINNQNHTIIGTPYWMAPEVILSEGHGRSADIWSLGCTILEMLTKSPPFAQLEPHAAMFRIAKLSGPPPLPESLSPELEDFLLKCLARNPTERPTALELINHSFLSQPLDLSSSPNSFHEPELLREIASSTYSVHSLQKRTQDVFDLASFPRALLFLIFEYLQPSELCVAAQVCGQWHELSQDPLLWRRLVQRRWGATAVKFKGNITSWRSAYMNNHTACELWFSNTLECLSLSKAHRKSISGLLISDDFVLSAAGKQIKVRKRSSVKREWLSSSSKSGKAVVKGFSLTGHSAPIVAIKFMGGSFVQCMVSAAEDKTVRIWDLKQKKTLDTIVVGHRISSLGTRGNFSKTLIAVGVRSSIVLYDVNQPLDRARQWDHAHYSSISCLGFLDENTVVSASHDNTVKVWDVRSPSIGCIRTFHGHSAGVTCMHVEPTNSFYQIVTGSEDSDLRLWNVSRDKAVGRLYGHSGTVLSVCADTTKIVSTSEDLSARIWPVGVAVAHGSSHPTAPQITLPVQANPTCCALDRDLLAVGTQAKELKFWRPLHYPT